jgi:RHS repeat-associated protein
MNPSVNTANNRLNGYTFDAAGNMTADPQGRRFTYDAENKQVNVATIDENGNPIAIIGQYAYDGDGKRVKKIVPGTGEMTVFVYDAAGKQIAEYLTIVALVEDAKVAYLTADHLGSPRINTNQDGNVTSRTDYMPYGEEITSGRSSSQGYITDDVRQGFTGYETDNEIGLDYAQARYYGNSHGRFTSVDPIIISNERLVDPQAMNLYVYTRNNPLISVDPTGEYFVGTDGKRVEYEIKEGKIVFTSNNVSKDLQRMADLVSSSGSQKALTQFTRLANNDTMIHFKIETGKRDDGLLGLHQVHDKDGNALEWDSENGKFKGDPAYIKDKDGNYVYKEATITIYEGNIEESIDFLRNSGKVKDPALTTQEYMVSTFGHEGEHDLNTKAIATIKKRQDGGDKYNVFKKVEKPAYDVTFKILKEIKEARNKN